MEHLAEALLNLHWSEGFAVLFGILYIILAAKESAWCWFWGIISCLLWAWAAFYLYNLYIDALLQIFYIGISFAGIWQWLYGGKENNELPIRTLSRNTHIIIIATGFLFTFAAGYFFEKYTPAAATYLDAFTTVFSIITTFMVVKKILENWMYWIVIDIVYVYLYGSRGSILFTILFVIYLIIAVAGWMKWRKNHKSQTIQEST